MKKVTLMFFITLIICSCNVTKDVNNSKIDSNILKIATTTSLYNSGLLDILKYDFEQKTNVEVEYIVVGSGAAMELAENGDVDGVFVHSKESEEMLVQKGVSLGRNTIMFNYFQIVGFEKLETNNFEHTLNDIRENKLFVSRADNSGTNVKELQMWGSDIPKQYVETGKGMLDTLIMTSELQGYTLTDDATFITNSDKFDLVEVYKNDEFFKNEYSYHSINPNINKYINNDASNKFLNYLKNEETLHLIESYGLESYGKSLYKLSK